ncbi:magnesium transporter [Haloquadratum walsbyi]|uniref:MgtE family transport protein n=1 Tax=Haloquadratum walsbyi (strain DSM 16790 / HBSQ001) TaxID=362976 RepID=Q18EV4_HALWD|nr:magnesium transporter [Haloquadratum walsbyi]CAJ53513.1 MgtE family transport protein [Haloquadratum walsbyi DSM 16790]
MPTAWTVRAITRAMFPILVLLTLVEVGSGLVLNRFEAQLLRYPTLLALVPVMIGTAGNLGSILAARLSTAFHLGTLSFDIRDDTLTGNALATIALSVSIFPIVGIGAWSLTALTGMTRLELWRVVIIALLAGVCLAVLATCVTVITTYLAYQLELDPDDVVLPAVTNICDVLGVIVLFLVVQILV